MHTISAYAALLTAIRDRVRTDWVIRESGRLNDLEYGQTFRDYAAAARYAYDLARAEGLEAELLTFPADGRTTYLDARTPMAWEADAARLTVTKSPVEFAAPVVADFQRHPFHLVKHSTATPPGGVRTRLLREREVLAGADCRGAMVLLEFATPPRPYAIRPLLERGALGFVADYIRGGELTPDALQWVNAAVEDCTHWHVQSEDADFIGFTVTPRTGRALREAMDVGEVEVLVESDGRRYEGELHAVTALLPGRSKKEIWIQAHLYEPLIADNSASVVMAIEAARLIRDLSAAGVLPMPEYSIRLVFAMELYGFCAVAEHFGVPLSDRVIGAINVDCMPIEPTDRRFHLMLTPYAAPFYGSYLLEMLMDAYMEAFPGTEGLDRMDVSFGDDISLGDPTVGVPGVWPEHQADDFWHNSIQSNDFLDAGKIARCQAMLALWAAAAASPIPDSVVADALQYAQRRLNMESRRPTMDPAGRMGFFLAGERRRLADFARVTDSPAVEAAVEALQLPENPLVRFFRPEEPLALKNAENIIPRRLTAGFPHDLVRFPKSERRDIRIIYGALGSMIAAMDGKHDLASLIRGGLWEHCQEVTEKAVAEAMDVLQYLEKGGYIALEHKEK